MVTEADNVEDKMVAQTLRVVLDGMVKCFSQLYCDVNQGFPGYKHATWQKTDKVKVELSLAEITMIQEALDYALEQVQDSCIPVFGAFSHRELVHDGITESYTAYTECSDEEVAGAEDAIASIKSTLSLLFPHDGGIIEINA